MDDKELKEKMTAMENISKFEDLLEDLLMEKYEEKRTIERDKFDSDSLF